MGKNILCAKNSPSSSRSNGILAKVAETQRLLVRNMQRAEERNQDNLEYSEIRTLEIINAQSSLFRGELEQVKKDSTEQTTRIEAVESKLDQVAMDSIAQTETVRDEVKQLRQLFLTNPSTTVTLPVTRRMTFIQKNAKGEDARLHFPYKQFTKDGRRRGFCPVCFADYSQNYLRKHMIKKCLVRVQ